MIGCITFVLFLTTVFTAQEEPVLPTHPTFHEDNFENIHNPNGIERNIGDLLVYESRKNETENNGSPPKILLIAVYDLFGLHHQVKYISDRLTLNPSFKSIVPDFLRGQTYDPKNWPPPNFKPSDLNNIFYKNGSWEHTIKSDLKNLIDHYKAEGFTGFGMYSFCWGGKISVFAAADQLFKDVGAIGLVHPSKVITKNAEDSRIPMILLPSKDEPDMIPFLDILNKNLMNKSEHKRFSNVGHGFAGARSDFSDPNIRGSVNEVINLLSEFFLKQLS